MYRESRVFICSTFAAGVWYVDILQDGVSVVGSPFKVNVFNAALASIIKTGDVASLNVPYVFQGILVILLSPVSAQKGFDDAHLMYCVSPPILV